ncbi:conserved hypothetical protein [Talaromyces stipitatus ATCC 10500]|uniref:Uncharacterized protein n=1 Tax=Talaromyces stipitatus (strain ATCC 10500 / CBS 375.48 / QM 6759 / NRRL 1006) TaxID=441959 RepID=B8MH49_TALSN|nr:uncharacterized protein TSTA_019260 [Talaromyces stipitatus ATCC 10500]EED16863.1 conserved hypothetical protein [Talaromyces stipitatus ATCC 10500]
MSTPSSPVSPRHRRHPSSFDMTPTINDANDNGYFYLQTPQSPGSLSADGQHLRHSISSNSDRRMSAVYMGAVDSGGGLGNLADELADAWGDGEGYEYASGIEVNDQMNNIHDDNHSSGEQTPREQTSPSDTNSLQPPRNREKQIQNRHHRRTESQYDGSDYGNDSDFEEGSEFSPNFERRLAGIESLARRGIEENGSSNDQIIQRFVEGLRDLGAQSGIENGAARLITAHTSITSHLTHQTRALQTLIHPLLFSHFPLLSLESMDDLIPLIDEGLLPNLPLPFSTQQTHNSSLRPQSASSSRSSQSQAATSADPLLSLQALLGQTSDLTLTLRTLSDTLHESRQLTSTASRRLRSARELVAEIKREDEDREEGHRWIESGQWDRKLKEREAGRVCGEVVSGFEAVCGEWRRKLFGASGASSAPAATEAAA